MLAYRGGRGVNSSDLPMASVQTEDGSGRSVKMDAPVVRAWKNASGYIKGSYFWLAGSILLMLFGIWHLRYSWASVDLNCHSVECTLYITPPGRKGSTVLHLARSQMVGSNAVKVTKRNRIVELDTSQPLAFDYRNNKNKNKSNKKKNSANKGPDEKGNYDSYTLILKDYNPDEDDVYRQRHAKTINKKKTEEVLKERDAAERSLERIAEYISEKDEQTGHVTLLMRQFNLGQTKRRTRNMVSKIEAYMKRRRHKLSIKENRAVSWQGVLSLVVGIFSLLLCVLLGEFREQHKFGGPGARARKKSSPTRKDSAPPGQVANLGGSYTRRKQY